MEFSEFIQRFAETFGIPVPEVVDDAAAFDADGMPLFLMRIVNEGESEYLVIAADLGEPPPERMEKLYEALLDAGHAFAGAGGGVFARNPADGHIWLQLREAYASIDVESAIAKVKALGEAAVNWRDIIREYREGSSIPEAQASGGLSDDGTGAESPPGMRNGELSQDRATKVGLHVTTCEFQITGLGSGNPQIASLGVRQDIEALDQ